MEKLVSLQVMQSYKWRRDVQKELEGRVQCNVMLAWVKGNCQGEGTGLVRWDGDGFSKWVEEASMG